MNLCPEKEADCKLKLNLKLKSKRWTPSRSCCVSFFFLSSNSGNQTWTEPKNKNEWRRALVWSCGVKGQLNRGDLEENFITRFDKDVTQNDYFRQSNVGVTKSSLFGRFSMKSNVFAHEFVFCHWRFSCATSYLHHPCVVLLLNRFSIKNLLC